MKIEFDQEKSDKNQEKRGLSFACAADFDWESSLMWQDNRQEYCEDRFCAIGLWKKAAPYCVYHARQCNPDYKPAKSQLQRGVKICQNLKKIP